MVNLKSDRASN